MTYAAKLGAALALLLAAVCPVLGGENPEESFWVLSFSNETPKPLVIESLDGGHTYYWYMVYHLKNTNDKPVPSELSFKLELTLAKQTSTYSDVSDLPAKRHLATKVVERPLMDSPELAKTLMKPGEAREGVAIFRLGPDSVDFDRMVISVKGLTQRRPLGREGESNVRKFRDRIFILKYNYVPSRWTTGKDLKLDEVEGEFWKLVESEATDRTDAQDEKAKETLKKLDELRAIIDKELGRVPLPEPGKAAPKAAPKAEPKGEPKAEPKASIGPTSGEAAAPLRAQSAKLLAELRATSGRRKAARATFTEVIGAGENQRRTVTGTLLVGPGGKMAIERLQGLATGQTLKETRVFDGETLWAQTSAKDVGDVVRRWAAAGAKKEWCQLDGRPEVDFATIVNPARAWRLFGDGLVFLGSEQLEKEAAYVFEVRPDARYAAIISGPLSGDLLGLPAAKRFRFWLGVQSGFQLRLQAYDEQGVVLGVLECTEVEPDAQVDPRRFAFQPPKGVDVVDMNAATAAADK